jgi:hypothetical protein
MLFANIIGRVTFDELQTVIERGCNRVIRADVESASRGYTTSHDATAGRRGQNRQIH